MSESKERKQPSPCHATVRPHVMEHISVGTFKIKGTQPQFDITFSPEEGKDSLTYKSVQLVDFTSMTYELVYNCQNFSAEPIHVTIAWAGGQPPITSRQ